MVSKELDLISSKLADELSQRKGAMSVKEFIKIFPNLTFGIRTFYYILNTAKSVNKYNWDHICSVLSIKDKDYQMLREHNLLVRQNEKRTRINDMHATNLSEKYQDKRAAVIENLDKSNVVKH